MTSFTLSETLSRFITKTNKPKINIMNKNKDTASFAWVGIETHINYILEHLKDGLEVGNIEERVSEIERHARGLKSFYDWIDNNCHLDFY